MTEIQRRRVRPVIGPGLRTLLAAVLLVVALMVINSAYLALVTLLEWRTGQIVQNQMYQYMFLFHLVVGLLLIVPLVIFMGVHARNAWHRPNRRAVYAGLSLMACVLVLLISGLLLIRFDFFEINRPWMRNVVYWMHVLVPLAIAWLFILHRLAGPAIRWRSGLKLAGAGASFVVVLIVWQSQDLTATDQPGVVGEVDFMPALVRTADGQRIDGEVLMNDQYCQTCHADSHAQWSESVHRFASFNNPVYRFAVENTREKIFERDGNMDAARFCAACHDVVPLLTGRFDDPHFDGLNDPTGQAGITCTTCHAVSHINSPRGNGDFTITEPVHYPFAFSENSALQWVNAQLIKANPAFHKKTFLKPLHQSPEFCGSCHKVHIPEVLNDYKWLRGQNHYDSFLLSGVSGHGVTSFYYPPQAQPNCNQCHMPLVESNDFGAQVRTAGGAPTIHDHLFPAANTGIAHLLGFSEDVILKHQQMLEDSLRVDLVGVRKDGRIDGELIAPIRPVVPALEPGREYLLQAVIRTLTLGHMFTQGTSDSNEIWMAAEVRLNGELIGRSGGLDPVDGRVDPWSHFVNNWMLDRDGNRIDRRNAEDIFVPLYNHQIPPGAADVVHYRLAVPPAAEGELTVRLKLAYRKFDTTLMRHVKGETFVYNDLPITVMAEDMVTFPVGFDARPERQAAPDIPEWQRFNDYAIGALRKPERRQLRQAEVLFAEVEQRGMGVGALNLARVYLEEGRLDEAAEALRRARNHPNPPPAWSMAWFSGQLLFQQGQFEQALVAYNALAETQFSEARERGFDFSRDYRLLNQIGLTWLQIAQSAEAPAALDAQHQAVDWFARTLIEDPENTVAHYNLDLLYRQLGQAPRAAYHAAEYARYRIDDNARDRAIAAARRANPAANHAADPVVIYDLHRPDALQFSLPVRIEPNPTRVAQ